MDDKEIIIKPLKNVYKISNLIRIISFLFLVLTICGLMTEGYFVMLILQLLIFLGVHIYETIKIIRLRNEVFIFKNGKLITDKDIIDCKNTKYKLDKRGNIVFFIGNRKIKIKRLSYNFDALLTFIIGDDISVQKEGIM